MSEWNDSIEEEVRKLRIKQNVYTPPSVPGKGWYYTFALFAALLLVGVIVSFFAYWMIGDVIAALPHGWLVYIPITLTFVIAGGSLFVL